MGEKNKKVKPCAPERIPRPNKTDRVVPGEEMPEKGIGQDGGYLPDMLPSRRER